MHLFVFFCDLFTAFGSGWLGWGSSKSESGLTAKGGKENRTEPATPVYPKFGLADALREALTVVLSPNEKLAAVTDSLGRITLVDIYKGIAVRVWKGNRKVDSSRKRITRLWS